MTKFDPIQMQRMSFDEENRASRVILAGTQEFTSAAKELKDVADKLKNINWPVANLHIPESVEPKIITEKHERVEVIREVVNTKDSRVRLYTKLQNQKIKSELETISQNIGEILIRLEQLEHRKPEEKQLVTEKTVIHEKDNKMLLGGMVLSIVLSILAIILK